MLIAQISDTHILPPDVDQPAADLRADCLRRCVSLTNQLRPAAVLFTGDTVQHGQPEEYARLRELLAPLQAPLYLVPGNRDDKRELQSVFSDHSHLPRDGEFLQYTVEEHDIRFVALDSTLRGERKGRYCKERQAWLDAVLAEQPDRPTVLFIHHPPFDVGDHYVGGYRQPEEAIALAGIVSRHSQVIALICGHVHWPIECDWAGTQARIMPSVAVDLRKGVDESKARGRPIVMLHRLSGESGIRSEAKWADDAP